MSVFSEASHQRKQEPVKKRTEFAIKDDLSMANFDELIPDPAITYPFELDDFQKRAVYRME